MIVFFQHLCYVGKYGTFVIKSYVVQQRLCAPANLVAWCSNFMESYKSVQLAVDTLFTMSLLGPGVLLLKNIIKWMLMRPSLMQRTIFEINFVATNADGVSLWWKKMEIRGRPILLDSATTAIYHGVLEVVRKGCLLSLFKVIVRLLLFLLALSDVFRDSRRGVARCLSRLIG